MKRLLIGLFALFVVIAVVAAILFARRNPASPTAQQGLASASAAKAIPAAAASPPDDGNWTMPGKDYASTRFSGLTEITPGNVRDLGVAFTFSTATTHGYEAP